MPKRNINLLPNEIIQERKFKVVRKNLLYVSIVFLFVSVILFASIFVLLKGQQSRFNTLENQRLAVVSEISKLSDTEEQIQLLGIRAELISKIMKERFNYSDLLEELRSVTPNEVEVVSLVVEFDELALTGTASNYNSLTKFTRSLKQKDKNKIFIDGEISNISLNSTDGTVSYTINAFINPDGLINANFKEGVK